MNQQRTNPAAFAELCSTLEKYAPDFGLSLSAGNISALSRYYQLVTEWNPRLHLVAPCTAQEFALRHLLESLLVTRFVEDESTIIDVGTGAGFPAIPCLIVGQTLQAILIEASPKKMIFLRECAAALGLSGRIKIINERFETTAPRQAEALTCRALDRFTELLPQLLEWAAHIPQLLLFGGPSIQHKLEESATPFSAIHIPHSAQRSIFVVRQ